jgi:hypothetical protein
MHVYYVQHKRPDNGKSQPSIIASAKLNFRAFTFFLCVRFYRLLTGPTILHINIIGLKSKMFYNIWVFALIFFQTLAGSFSLLDNFNNHLLNKVAAFTESLKSRLSLKGLQYKSSTDYPYWNFLPQYRSTLHLGKVSTWETECQTFSALASREGQMLTVIVDVKSMFGGTDLTCNNFYMLITASVVRTIKFEEGHQVISLTIPDDESDAEEYYLNNMGVKVLQFLNDEATTLSNVIETFKLFEPMFTKRVPTPVAQKNIDFMKKYPQFLISSRDPLTGNPPAKHEVHSGDFFGIMRLDGLNPMLAWAMGSTTG